MTKQNPKQLRDDITRAVGHLLDQWSYVEQMLENSFAILLGVEEGPAHVAFSSIRSFHARLLVVNNLVESMGLHPDTDAEWRNLYNRASKKSEKRNEVAHFTIQTDTDRNGKSKMALHPYRSLGSDLLKGSKGPQRQRSPGLSAEDLKARTDSIVTLAVDMMRFNESVAGQLAQRQAYLGLTRYRGPAPSTPSDPTPTE